MLELFVTLQMLGQHVRERFTREDGATAVEYGLLVALIAAVIVVIVAALGTSIQTAFDKVCDKITAGGCNVT